MEHLKLGNSISIPVIGFGTWQIKSGAKEAVLEALKAGYRHIDTAAIYKNESAVGEAWVESGIRREELFLTTKLWNSVRGYEETLSAFEQSCRNLKTSYVDLYLIHWPKFDDAQRWRAIEDLYLAGKIKAIGVSNYHIHHYQTLMKTARIKPMVNQVECHPLLNQAPLRAFFKQEGIVVESYSPLLSGHALHDEKLQAIADAYDKTVAQVLLRWNLQNGCVILPKSVTPSRIAENLDLFGFSLSQKDMDLIDRMNTNTRVGSDPDNFDF